MLRFMRNLPRLLILLDRARLFTRQLMHVHLRRHGPRDKLRSIEAVEENRSLFERAVLGFDDVPVAERKLDDQPYAVDDLLICELMIRN